MFIRGRVKNDDNSNRQNNNKPDEAMITLHTYSNSDGMVGIHGVSMFVRCHAGRKEGNGEREGKGIQL